MTEETQEVVKELTIKSNDKEINRFSRQMNFIVYYEDPRC